MSNIVHEVLKLKPNTWETDDYEHKIFSKWEVCTSSSEYADVESAFTTSRSVKKIERVQNPFLYGKYIIRKEQLIKRGQNIKEVKCYFGISLEDIDSALEYNCDPRFTNNRSLYSSRSNPTFYMDPSYISSTPEAIIVLSALSTSNESYSFSKSTDTEYYPQYIVYF